MKIDLGHRNLPRDGGGAGKGRPPRRPWSEVTVVFVVVRVGADLRQWDHRESLSVRSRGSGMVARPRVAGVALCRKALRIEGGRWRPRPPGFAAAVRPT